MSSNLNRLIPISIGSLLVGASQRLLRTHVGATCLIENTAGKPLGHFIVPPKGVRVKVE